MILVLKYGTTKEQTMDLCRWVSSFGVQAISYTDSPKSAVGPDPHGNDPRVTQAALAHWGRRGGLEVLDWLPEVSIHAPVLGATTFTTAE